MPCDYVIYKELRLVITKAVGVVTFDEMKKHQARLQNDPEFEPEFNQLIDATGATGVELTRYGAEELTQQNIFPIRRSAPWSQPSPLFSAWDDCC